MARTHALGFLIAKAFIDLGIGSEPESVPPSFRGIASTIESVREDAGHLFTAILSDNPFAAEARRGFLDALARLDAELAHPPSRAEASAETGFPIPDFGARSPDLVEVRDLIDDVGVVLHDVTQAVSRSSPPTPRAERGGQDPNASPRSARGDGTDGPPSAEEMTPDELRASGYLPLGVSLAIAAGLIALMTGPQPIVDWFANYATLLGM